MFDSDNDEYQLVPLGKGTTGLGAQESDKAIRDYTRRAQQSWRQSKLTQAKERAFEAERLNALLENESKQRKLDREEAAHRKEIQAEKMLVQRKEQERDLQAQIEKRRQDYAAQILKERCEAKTRRQKSLNERRIHHDREVLARKKLFEIERRIWKRDKEEQEQRRQENVCELKRRAACDREQLQLSVQNAVLQKHECTKRDKSVQRKKETVQRRRLKLHKENLTTEIKELVDSQKKKRTQLEERRDETMHRQREAWRKEANTITQTIKERREADFVLIKDNHNIVYQREVQLRQERNGFYASNAFGGTANTTPPHRPVSAPGPHRPHRANQARTSPPAMRSDDVLPSRTSPLSTSPLSPMRTR